MFHNKNLEDELKDYVGTDYCILTGSGTMGLVIALFSQHLPRGSEIIVPDITCLTVPLSVIYAKMKPIFVDVKMDDYNINTELIYNKITKKTRAIIGVHSFGQPFDVDAIKKICDEYNLLLIEDFAQAFGGEYKNKLFGSFGDISVTSFGYNKVISAGGGGAVFTDDRKTYLKMKTMGERFKRYSTLPISPERFRSKLVDSYMGKFAKRGINVYSLTPKVFRLWYRLQKRSFLYPMKERWAQRIRNGLKHINKIKEITIKQGRLYKQNIKSKQIIHPRYELGPGVLWKYSVLLKKPCRRDILENVNTPDNFFNLVTNYSPPLHIYWEKRLLRSYPNSTFIASRILNLPVGLEYSNEQVREIAEIVNSSVEMVG